MKSDERKNLNRPITSKEIDLVIENLPTNESPGPDSVTANFMKHLEKS